MDEIPSPFLILAAPAQNPAPAALSSVPRPYFLSPADKTPAEIKESPSGLRDAQGRVLDLKESIHAPSALVLDRFSDPDLFEAVKGGKKTEKSIGRFYWHSLGDWSYCHYKDMTGNHWYGWNGEDGFHWILWRGNRFWWRDPFAKHWLYYRSGYWWRAYPQKGGTLQVLVDDEYYTCDREGKLLQDMGQDGQGNIDSGTGRFQGDMRGGGTRGGHGGHGGPGGPGPRALTGGNAGTGANP